MIAFVDFETRSESPLKDVGSYKYAEHPSTDVFCLSVKIGDHAPRIWLSPLSIRLFGDHGTDMPIIDDTELQYIMSTAWELHAHNANFERCLWHNVMVPRYGFEPVPIQKWRCTAAKAAVCNIPRSLDQACKVMGLQAKDKVGYDVMMKMCKPRKALKADKLRDPDWESRVYWHETPEMLESNCRYCLNDVVIEQALDAKLPKMTDDEMKVWALDQRINDRGVYIRIDEVNAIDKEVKVYAAEMNRTIQRLTTGMANKVTETAKILSWVRAHGLDIEDTQLVTIKKALADTNTRPEVKAVLELREAGSKLTSCAKYDAMVRAACSDNRVRGMFLYCGAQATGRWSGRLVQLQNLPRGTMKIKDVEVAIWTLTNLGGASLGDCVATVASSCIRGVISAAPGNVLYCADFANIEGRKQAWLSGEDWKINAFIEYDTVIGTSANGEKLRAGPDLYKLAFSNSFGVSVDSVTSDQRQVGKTQELALGFGGGVSALSEMAKTYGVDLEELPAMVLPRATPEQRERAEWSANKFMEGKKEKGLDPGMGIYAAEACDVLKQMWRANHPAIVAYWKECHAAAVYAIVCQKPKRARHVVMDMWCGFLRVTLPSGRCIYMYDPQVTIGDVVVRDASDQYAHTLYEGLMNPEPGKRPKCELTFWGVDSMTSRWMKKHTWGGDIFQSIVQGSARDIMAGAGLKVDSKGYPVILTVHDELISEVPKGYGSLEEYERLMSLVPGWASGLPIAVEGWTGERYRK